jgi:hypothetical protein
MITKEMKLHYKTVTPLMWKILIELMENTIFQSFNLAGGSSLSLRLGHRMSVDLDLFTNMPYGSLDFSLFELFFKKMYPYYSCSDTTEIVGFGRSYYVGSSYEENVKVDIYYHDEMIDPCDMIDNIRLASIFDVIAMKVDVISRGGRKKDFWDLHELLDTYSVENMLNFHRQRYEWTHNRLEIIKKFIFFEVADDEPDPVCLKGKDWELIKLDFFLKIQELKK